MLGYSAQPIQLTFSVQLSFSLKSLLKLASISSCFAGRSLTTYITSSTSFEVSKSLPPSAVEPSDASEPSDAVLALDDVSSFFEEEDDVLSPQAANTLTVIARANSSDTILTDFFIAVPPDFSIIWRLAQPLTEPIVMPLTKYFCTKG